MAKIKYVAESWHLNPIEEKSGLGKRRDSGCQQVIPTEYSFEDVISSLQHESNIRAN